MKRLLVKFEFNTRKILFFFSMATLLASIAMIGYVVFYLVYPFKGLVINKKPAIVHTKEVVAGEELIYELDFCRYSDKHAEVTRQFIDGVVYTMPPITAIAKEGCSVQDYALFVPSTLNSGTYRLRVLVVIHINKLREVQTIIETEPFKIIGLNELHEKEDEQKFEKIGL